MKKLTKLVATLTLSTLIFTSCGSSDEAFDTERQISVISREDGSGTRSAFIELFGIEVKDDNGEKHDMTTEEAIIANTTDIVMKNIISDPYSIGYVSLGSINDTIKVLNVDGVEASAENINNGTYSIYRPFNVATKGELSPATEDFMNYIMSIEGQEIVGQSYISVDATSNFVSNGASGKVIVSGSSSVTPIMEKLIEGYKVVNPNVTIELQMSDSSSGLKATMEGTADIGMASRELKDSEKAELTNTVIALDGIAMIVNQETPIDNITSEQVNKIYTGEITNWSDIITN